jgi:hypothetical protein
MQETLGQIKDLDAVASESGGVLAFRLCDGGDELEPVFARFRQEPGDAAGGGAAMISLSDRNGLSLGTYVLPMQKLRAALSEAPPAS